MPSLRVVVSPIMRHTNCLPERSNRGYVGWMNRNEQNLRQT